MWRVNKLFTLKEIGDKIKVRHKLNDFSVQVCIFTLVKMHALLSILVRVCNLCRSKRSYAFFVRGYGCALFILRGGK